MSLLKILLLSLTYVSLSYGLDPADWPKPPPFSDKPKTARYLAHNADWGVVSALSPEYNHRPFGTLQSFMDGPIDKSTGIPYFFIGNISDTYLNIKYSNQVSFTITEAMGTNCLKQGWDPEEPLCARMTLLGQMVPVTDQAEMKNVKQAMFARHPAMASWPTSHGWTFYKMELEAVHLIDFYGGASHVPLKDYFASPP